MTSKSCSPTSDESALQLRQQPIDVVDRVADKQFEVGRHLVIAAASRVQLASDISEPRNQRALDVHVNIFELHRIGELTPFDLRPDIVQRPHDRVSLDIGDETHLRQHPRVGLRTADVALCQPGIETDGFREFFHAGIGCLGKAAPPSFCGHKQTPLVKTGRSALDLL